MWGVMCSAMIAHAAVFEFGPIPDDLKQSLLHQKLWHSQCPVPLERLALLRLSYTDFAGQSHTDGEMIVLDTLAPQVAQLFQELYQRHFPIAKIRLTSRYGGDDQRSMAHNNTSAYNCRLTSDGSGLPSVHAYGAAIDINPVQNPWVGPVNAKTGMIELLPVAGREFVNRAKQRPGMSEPIVPLVANAGLSIWGGNWNEPIDWQHFQVSRTVAHLLTVMTPTDAEAFFALYRRYPRALNTMDYKNHGIPLAKAYRYAPARFVRVWQQQAKRFDDMPPLAVVTTLQQAMNEPY